MGNFTKLYRCRPSRLGDGNHIQSHEQDYKLLSLSFVIKW
jgi:hypothetical protein